MDEEKKIEEGVGLETAPSEEGAPAEPITPPSEPAVE